jgi:hypothetical protein
MTDGYENVRHAIVKQAIEDYARALIRGDKYKIITLERWFVSEWGQMLSGYNGEYIIEKVKKEVKI